MPLNQLLDLLVIPDDTMYIYILSDRTSFLEENGGFLCVKLEVQITPATSSFSLQLQPQNIGPHLCFPGVAGIRQILRQDEVREVEGLRSSHRRAVVVDPTLHLVEDLRSGSGDLKDKGATWKVER